MRATTILLAAAISLTALPTLAQEAAVTPAPVATAPKLGLGGHTVVRADLAAVLFSNADYNFWGHRGTLVPLLTSVEHHWGGRTSTVVEGLIGGGTPDTRRSGLSVQGRYYLQRKYAGLPLGLYVAPVLSYRAVRETPSYSPMDVSKRFVGAGALFGAQIPVGLQQRLVIDAAAGLMGWQQVGEVQVRHTGSYPEQQYNLKPLYELSPVLPDVRLGVGLRF
jgi:hypothetical protein